MNNPRKTRRYQNARRAALERDTHCWICHQPIDPRLRWPHPHSPSADHVNPLHNGGDPYDIDNLRAAHLHCNISRGNYTRRGINPQAPRARNW